MGADERDPADDLFDPDDEDDLFDCGMMPGGQCLKAGSEECDWECPHSRPHPLKRRRP